MTIRRFLSAFLVAAALGAPALAIETKAEYAYMIDFDTHDVLLSKNADVKMHPSSMSKLMTTYVLYSRMKEGRVKLDDKFMVSEKAWRMQGSKMFIHVGDEVPVEELIRGIVIQSGNDACIAVAEGVSGNEEAFATEMNRIAAAIGLTNSHFVNATGWPDENHLTTARDLGTLAEHIIRDFPEHYHFYSETEFTYNNIRQPNRNRLLQSNIGVDGLKTGHTDQAGYGITLSAKDKASGRRLILVINGLKSDNERVEEGDKLLRWGFREFVNRPLVKAGQVVEKIPVWMGEKKDVPVTVAEDRVVTLPANAKDKIKFTLSYTGPVPAPIEAGAHIADLRVDIEGREPITVPLVAAEPAAKLSGFSRMLFMIEYYLFGKKA